MIDWLIEAVNEKLCIKVYLSSLLGELIAVYWFCFCPCKRYRYSNMLHGARALHISKFLNKYTFSIISHNFFTEFYTEWHLWWNSELSGVVDVHISILLIYWRIQNSSVGFYFIQYSWLVLHLHNNGFNYNDNVPSHEASILVYLDVSMQYRIICLWVSWLYLYWKLLVF